MASSQKSTKATSHENLGRRDAFNSLPPGIRQLLNEPYRKNLLNIASGTMLSWHQQALWVIDWMIENWHTPKDIFEVLRTAPFGQNQVKVLENGNYAGRDLWLKREIAKRWRESEQDLNSEDAKPELLDSITELGDDGIIEEATDIDPERVRWLWRNYIPAATLTILAGDPGMGKSMIAIHVAARASRGEAMPDGYALSRAMSSAIASAEDKTANTITPRLMAANANCKLVKTIRKVNIDGKPLYLSFPRDFSHLKRHIIEGKRKLVIIDPLNAFVEKGVDTYKDQDIRGILAPLEDIAEESGASIVIIAHLNKKEDASTLYRVGGSIGFIGAARSVLGVSYNAEEQTNVLYSLKSNLSRKPPALRYSIEEWKTRNSKGEQITTSKIVWSGVSEFDPLRKSGRGDGLRVLILEFLKQELDDGEVEAEQVRKDLASCGICSWKTLGNYKASLGVRSVKKGEKWFWDKPVKWVK